MLKAITFDLNNTLIDFVDEDGLKLVIIYKL